MASAGYSNASRPPRIPRPRSPTSAAGLWCSSSTRTTTPEQLGLSTKPPPFAPQHPDLPQLRLRLDRLKVTQQPTEPPPPPEAVPLEPEP